MSWASNLIGVGSQLRSAFNPGIAAGLGGIPGDGLREWPIVRRLREQVEVLHGLADFTASLLFALKHCGIVPMRTLRRGSETWSEVAAHIIGNVRNTMLADEERALRMVLEACPCEILVLPESRPGEFRLTANR
jgi:hypothetical protein